VIKDLGQFGLSVDHIIINGVIESPDSDFLQQRSEMQLPYLDMLEDEYGDRMTLTRVPLLPHEVKGIERLSKVEEILFRGR
jgi:anion-transporting  ArsA/GET3 family ATPase